MGDQTGASEAAAAAWEALYEVAREPRADGSTPDSIRPLFSANPNRFSECSSEGAGIFLDWSKTSISPDAFQALLGVAEAMAVEEKRTAMLAGHLVNGTERRAVLHIALRAPAWSGFRADLPGGGSEDASSIVVEELQRMEAFCAEVHSGRVSGATGHRFTDIVNIGIGGSDLGPFMAARALWTPASPMRAHYLANMDANAWLALAAKLDPARTLVLVASKTFTTLETMTNARLARAWLQEHLGEDAASQHLVALSTNMKATADFGIPPERVFGFRDWVGGRFSLWSAIGLSLGLALGWESFIGLLQGAHAMDQHFESAPLAENLPVLMALAEVWHLDAMGYGSRAVLPYDERLARLPAHLQQLEMESLGKRVTMDGQPVPHPTGAPVFGEPGTNAQHSFMQLVHQGTRIIPVDFILIARPAHAVADSHRKLLANGLAQSAALLAGREAPEVRAEMEKAGLPPEEIERLLPHRLFPGNRPSLTLMLEALTPYSMGALIALYENKVFCLGALWDIDAFDQWGVELGKALAGRILPAFHGEEAGLDPSTTGLLERLKAAWPAASS